MLSKLGGSSRPRKKSVALGFLNNLVAVLEHQTSQQQELMTQDKKLNEVIDEILVTEATYLEDLSFTVDELQRPLKEMMDAHTHYTVFSNLEQLRELQQLEFQPEQLAYSFRSSLMRDVIYTSMTFENRKALHTAAADLLLQGHGRAAHLGR